MSNKTIYVAAASSEIERAKMAMRKLREAGFDVLSNWPEVIEKSGQGTNPMHIPREERAAFALTDLDQVARSSALWVLLPSPGKDTIGAWVEMGFFVALQSLENIARAQGIPDVPVRFGMCSGQEKSIFSALLHHFETDEEAFEALTAPIVTPEIVASANGNG